MAAIGHLTEFQPQKEKVSDYLERVSLYLEANGVAKTKQMAVLLTAIGGETYAILTSLLSPANPRDKTFTEITKHILSPSLSQSRAARSK